jgi:ABC-type uncharacterized transport system involved in gliding motility auxiliary subunit
VLQKLLSNLGNIGLVLLAGGLLYYSINELWDWKTQVGVYGGVGLLVVFLILNRSKVRRSLGTRMGRMGGTALATFVLVIGILAFLSFLNFRHHKRYDLSEGQLHSLSDQTIKILQNLDQRIEVVGFYQDEGEATQFKETIQEYHYVSPKVEFEIVDPQKDPGRVAQFQVTRNGQVVVVSPAKREILDQADEEKITNAIIKVTRDEEKAIYFLTGHGERDLEATENEGYSTVKEEIEKQNYRVESYNLAQENQVPQDAAVIVSGGSKVNFFPNEVRLLEEYLASGGKFFLLVDPQSEFQMNDFLEQYGITLEDDFVVDATGVGQLFGFGPAAPLAAEYTDHAITRDLKNTMTVYPTARSVSVTSSSLGYTVTELAKSSPQSWGETDIQQEEVSFDEAFDTQGPLPLAVVATKSADTPDPQSSEEDLVEESEASAEIEVEDIPGGDKEDTGEEEESESREARLVVFGDPDFAANAYFGISVNGDLFLNVISWLAEDTDLISIRPKNPENRNVTLTAQESRLIFLATVLFFPLATLVFGVAVWYRRK